MVSFLARYFTQISGVKTVRFISLTELKRGLGRDITMTAPATATGTPVRLQCFEYRSLHEPVFILADGATQSSAVPVSFAEFCARWRVRGV